MSQLTTEKSFKQRFLPHLMIVAIFLLVSIVFCLPAFKGQVLNQSDYLGWFNTAHSNYEHYKQTGENLGWMNTAFSGMPSIMTVSFSNANWFRSLSRGMVFGIYGQPNNPAVYFFWAMLAFYLLMMALNINKWLALLGAVAFAFSSYNPIIISVGHTTKMMDILLFPGILAGIIWLYKGKYGLGGIITLLFMGLFFAQGHYQIIYYGGIAIGVWVLAELIFKAKKGQIKQWIFPSLLLLGITVITAATQFFAIIPGQKYEVNSIRGGQSELSGDMHAKGGGLDKEYAFQWSNGVGETFCLLVPNLYGGSSTEDIGMDSHYGETLTSLGVNANQVSQMTANAPTYWGPQPFLAGPIYFGAIICFLFILSLLVIKHPLKWWIAGISLFFIFLSMGKNFSSFNYFLFDHFPMLNKFRTPSMALSIPSVLFPMLAIWGLAVALRDKISKEELFKKLKIAGGITVGILVILLFATYGIFDYKAASDAQILQMGGDNQEIGQRLLSAIHDDRAAVARKDIFRSLVYIILAGGILWLYAKDKLKKELVIGGLVLLVGFDEISVAHRYLNDNNYIDDYVFEQNFQPRPADAEIMKDKDPNYRVLDLSVNTFNDSKPSYFHRSVGGYHPAKLEIYQELIENQLAKMNSSVINMLNTKYFILPGNNGQPARVQQNPGACGPAWFVSNIKWAENAQQAMDGLNAPSLSNPTADTSGTLFNPNETAILRDSLKTYFANYNIGKSEEAHITANPINADKIEYQTHNTQDGLAVFSEIYYPDGWTATIDGKKAHIMRTNFVLRALKVPAGDHKIEFTFEEPGAKEGNTISRAASIVSALFIFGALGLMIRKKKKGTSEDGGDEKDEF